MYTSDVSEQLHCHVTTYRPDNKFHSFGYSRFVLSVYTEIIMAKYNQRQHRYNYIKLFLPLSKNIGQVLIEELWLLILRLC